MTSGVQERFPYHPHYGDPPKNRLKNKNEDIVIVTYRFTYQSNSTHTHTRVTAHTHTRVTAHTNTRVTAHTHTRVTAHTHTRVTAHTHTIHMAGMPSWRWVTSRSVLPGPRLQTATRGTLFPSQCENAVRLCLAHPTRALTTLCPTYSLQSRQHPSPPPPRPPHCFVRVQVPHTSCLLAARRGAHEHPAREVAILGV